MQKLATRIFIYSSIAFGIIGIVMILAGGPPDGDNAPLQITLMKLLWTSVFIILPSFALSVASKYLNSKS